MPKLCTSLPDSSNFRITGSGDIAFFSRSQQLLTPQRSPTQIDLPSLSMSTALVDPQVRPAGILKWFSMVVYGLGASLTGAGAIWP